MIDLLIGAGLYLAPINHRPNPLLDITTVQVEKPKELTIEEKVAQNYYKCDETKQWIRSDNAECLDKEISIPEYSVKTTTVAGNAYEPGQCTWFVKSKRPDLPNNLGNAYSWFYMAQAEGLKTGYIPRVGAVGQRGNHVVYVEAVNEDTITISEMNYDYIPYHSRTIEVGARDYRYIY